MATPRQEKLAQVIVENALKDQPLNRQEMLEKVGYATSVAEHKPHEIFNSQGVQEELKKLGFDSNNAKRVIGEILNDESAENKDRLKAGELVLKTNGDLGNDRTPPPQNNTINFFTSKDIQEKVHDFEERLLKQIGYGPQE